MSAEQNRDVCTRYHDFRVEEMDGILTQGLIGHGPKGATWTLEMHKKYWQTHRDQTHDAIIAQVAEGNTVATRFIRQGTHGGKRFKAAGMSFNRFEGAKIAEIWEIWEELEAE
jgi:hypothetical protein